MATSIQLCSSCKVKPSNPGRKWCESCFFKSKLGLKYTNCRVCGKPPNPGFDLCENCYQNDVAKLTPATKMCVICAVKFSLADKDVCRDCLASMEGTNNAQPVSHPICIQCNINPVNPGYTLCRQCYQRSSSFPMNGIFPQHMQFGQHFLPAPHYPQYIHPIPSAFNSAYRNFPNPVSKPKPPEKTSNKNILDMSSRVVKRDKRITKINPPINRVEVFHCVCPHCYSDNSRMDLFYCFLCLEKVVKGSAVYCEDCINKEK